MDQAIPRMHTIMGNNAKYKQLATPMAMRLSIQKLKECRGDVEETEAMSSKPWQPQGGIENPRSPREAWKAVGSQEAGKAPAFGSILGWPQAT